MTLLSFSVYLFRVILFILVRFHMLKALSWLFLTKDGSTIELSTYNFGVKGESIWGSWLTWINLALVIFLYFHSLFELFFIILGSLNLLST